jgi:hypothetical protein
VIIMRPAMGRMSRMPLLSRTKRRRPVRRQVVSTETVARAGVPVKLMMFTCATVLCSMA